MADDRAGPAEREAAMAALDEHHRAARLDAAEYRRRSAVAAHATGRGEIDVLFADLPAPHPWSPSRDVAPGPEGRDVDHDAEQGPPPGGASGAGVATDPGSARPRPPEREPVDLPELVTPFAATVARHAGLLSLLTPVIAFGLFAATGFRFPFAFLLVPVAIGVLTYWAHRHGS